MSIAITKKIGMLYIEQKPNIVVLQRKWGQVSLTFIDPSVLEHIHDVGP